MSDKTLLNLAMALNREAWELLLPDVEKDLSLKRQSLYREQNDKTKYIADLITKKRDILRRTTDQAMEDLLMEVIKDWKHMGDGAHR